MQFVEKKYRWLILPLETKVRELDGKLLLAAHAAERGWGVIIGHKDTIAAETANINGLVLEKDGYTGNTRIDEYLRTGKHVCALDEEGLVYLSSQDYFRRRLNRDNLQKMDYFFLWGNNQRKDVLEHIPGVEHKLVMTGNPRFDLLRLELRDYYKAEKERLFDLYGQFILINTNFADSNHFLGTDWVLQNHRNSGFIKTDQQEAEEVAFIRYQTRIVNAFKEIVPKLSHFYPDHKIIIRPHPSENHAAWVSVASPLNNVLVIHEGDVNAWLLAADMVIHNSCMTGIQAFLLDMPTITYMPVQSDQFDYHIPNALSIKTTNLDELLSVVGQIENDRLPPEVNDRKAKLQIADQFITGISGPLAVTRIMDVFESLNITAESYKMSPPEPEMKTAALPANKNITGVLKGVVNKITRRQASEITPEVEKIHLAYSRQKFPGLSVEDIEERMNRLHVVTGQFANIQVRQQGSHTFCILPE